MRTNKIETAVYTVYTAVSILLVLISSVYGIHCSFDLISSHQQCIRYTLPMRLNKVETAVNTVYTADEN